MGSWHPSIADRVTPASVKIDVGFLTKLTAIEIRGQMHSKFVGPYSFIVKTSINGRDFSTINANLNQLPVVINNRGRLDEARMHQLPFPVITRYVQILIVAYKHWPRMALELYGTSECQYRSGTMPVGVDRALPRTYFSVPGGTVGRPGLFTIGNNMHAPKEGTPYFQMSTPFLYTYRAIATQARSGHGPPGDYAVHTYTIAYSAEGGNGVKGKGPTEGSFKKYIEAASGEAVTFRGNDCEGETDRKSVV